MVEHNDGVPGRGEGGDGATVVKAGRGKAVHQDEGLGTRALGQGEHLVTQYIYHPAPAVPLLLLDVEVL